MPRIEPESTNDFFAGLKLQPLFFFFKGFEWTDIKTIGLWPMDVVQQKSIFLARNKKDRL